jgi:hypothetical protein
MKKMFAMVLLVSATVVACSGKQASTTPTNKTQAQETNGDPNGGAAYGGATYGGKAAKPAPKSAANPCSPH